ncbi:MAG: hypothetical protein RI885_640 [Actinomycetota bacterium]|jgi:DNA-binding IclR family transcriptional regulator
MRSTQRATGNSVVGRAALVLDAFRQDDASVGVSELARRTGLPKSTVSRLVGELVDVALLERVDGSVRLGVRLFELGEHAARPRDLKKAATAHMIDLGRATGQTIHLAVLDGTDVVYIQILRALRGPSLPSRVGGRLPAHATGVGKALLAHADEATLAAVIDRGLPRIGPHTITTASALMAELESIRESGMACEHEESTADVACAASPILAADGSAIAAVSASGWDDRMNAARIAPAVMLAAMGIARMLDKPRVDAGFRMERA